MDSIKISLFYKDKEFNFNYGSEAYIFHTGIYNDIDKKYGIKNLLKYTTLVQDCYLNDSNRTPLGALADYVAEHWTSLKKLGKHTILNKFYSENY